MFNYFTLDGVSNTDPNFNTYVVLPSIGDSANFASITLHRRAGFRFCGTLHSVGYKFGRWLDSVVMELPLGEGDTSAPAQRSSEIA